MCPELRGGSSTSSARDRPLLATKPLPLACLQYNDDIRDLLDPEHPDKAVTMREDVTGAVVVAGLHEAEVGSAEDMMLVLRSGFKQRSTVGGG